GVPGVGGLREGFRGRGLRVAFTEFLSARAVPLLVGALHPEHRPAEPGRPQGFGWPSSSCLEGTASAETVAELAPAAGEPVIRKHWYDGFAGTALDGALRARRGASLAMARAHNRRR